MGTLEDIEAGVDALKIGQEQLKTKVDAVDLRLDDVRALVLALKAGQVNQAKIDEILSKVDAAKAAQAQVVAVVDSVSSEVDSIE